MHFLIAYSWVIFALDWASTIGAHNCLVEENPFMRDIWCGYGDVGFTVVSVGFAVLMNCALWAGWKYGYRWAVIVAAIPVLTFKLVIALTNLVVVPYSWTAWWQY